MEMLTQIHVLYSYFMEKITDRKRDELNNVTQEICVKVRFRIGIP